MTKPLDRYAAADALGISYRQFRQLQHNPTFPKPIGQWPDVAYDPAEIASFAAHLEECRRRGWKVPDCLYAWEWVGGAPRRPGIIIKRRAPRSIE